ncbi:uncharacterized protein FIBRA_09236 [Fibroporia radiculosa]|uniref:Reverse transcriptase domain-containing protein n=1 Tax=Fibroporia radiculosa TaxID=599839 RepID=J7S659_9APHY|nr:uncharacterized protein FIBRA_09236 [Fibroporia radiculosa]CCM06924.1 predicted protein [Fibroporia radiculosa]
MFFGMTNSLTIFQAMIDGIFADLLLEGWLVIYIDNILIYSTNSMRLKLPPLGMTAIPRHKNAFEQSPPFDIFEVLRSHNNLIGIFWWQLYSGGSTLKTKPHHPEIETYDTGL